MRVTRLEEQIKAFAEREWVIESLSDLTRTVDRLALQISTVIEGQKQLYITHDALLRERAEHEREQASNERLLLQKRLEERTALSIAKRWLPMATLFATILALITLARTVIEQWIRNLH